MDVSAAPTFLDYVCLCSEGFVGLEQERDYGPMNAAYFHLFAPFCSPFPPFETGKVYH